MRKVVGDVGRVLNVIPSSSGGGAERVVRTLTRAMQSKSVCCETLYFSANSEDDLLGFEHSLGVSYKNPLIIFALRKFIKSRMGAGGLIVHAHLTWGLYYVFFASLFLPVRLVYTEHSTYNSRRKYWVFRFFDRLVYSRFDRVVCISEGVRQSLLSWIGPKFDTKLFLILNGADIYEYRARKLDASRLPSFVSIGSLNPHKGFQLAIEALADISAEFSSYSIFGEGAYRESLERLIVHSGLQGKVHLMGWTDDVEKALHGGDIQLIPSVWEGFGLTAVEGMSTGLPLVISDVSGLREVVGNGKFAVLVDPAGGKAAWVSAIRELIERFRQNQERLSIEARRRALFFRNEFMVDSYFRVYSTLLHNF
ncbi:glycosyltransferase [Halopseudomonas oceani]|uniref:glycosyltransferase n=1 Tax=Halopseudomonas oceani TaxID=1708783 RepID=UPI002AA8E290|nr:glycosyltransferase [Halopseudomonas oceani]